VSEFLAKIENSDLDYFLSGLEISPDGRGVAVIIDLLGTRKEYVGMFKVLGQGDGVARENVVFNLKPEVSLQN
jgi:hypothetical protein